MKRKKSEYDAVVFTTTGCEECDKAITAAIEAAYKNATVTAVVGCTGIGVDPEDMARQCGWQLWRWAPHDYLSEGCGKCDQCLEDDWQQLECGVFDNFAATWIKWDGQRWLAIQHFGRYTLSVVDSVGGQSHGNYGTHHLVNWRQIGVYDSLEAAKEGGNDGKD